MDERAAAAPLDRAEGMNGQIELHDDRVRIRWKDSFGNLRTKGRTHTDVLLADVREAELDDATDSSSGRITIHLRDGGAVEPPGAPEPTLRFKEYGSEDVRRVHAAIEKKLGGV